MALKVFGLILIIDYKNKGIQKIWNEKFLVYLNKIKTKPKIKEMKIIKKEEKKA